MLARFLFSVLPPVFVLTIAGGAAANDEPPIRCRLSATSPQSAGGPVVVDFTLVNTGPEDLGVLIWGTPFEGWLGKVFIVERGEEALRYGGPMVKRADPEAGEYHLLPAAGEISATADLSQVYTMEPGTYTVTFAGLIHDLATAGEPIPRGGDERNVVRVECDSIELVVE